jgi:DNA transformation protein
MAARSAEEITTALDGLGLTRTRRMFGGLALYHQEQVFGFVFEGALYFRVNEATRKAYDRAGMPALQIPGVQKPSSRYMQVPAKVLDNPEQLRAWSQQAVATSAVDSTAARKAARRDHRPA